VNRAEASLQKNRKEKHSRKEYESQEERNAFNLLPRHGGEFVYEMEKLRNSRRRITPLKEIL
jgi:hypothetical protein